MRDLPEGEAEPGDTHQRGEAGQGPLSTFEVRDALVVVDAGEPHLDGTARLAVSGERADLSPLLPVLG
ncbi:hypothetical protein [Streptomyces boncukensis]|uniref:Uncharacterized protein n=1 Tax=Streptomyces boncukensis TaxID=2711219 RepID=A0A6G4WR07_9ACTN|nr:hypothetical protein [Streptomyces boncukensis]NGO67635.1 hypothetical protein [Streptomyces boncukensis]